MKEALLITNLILIVFAIIGTQIIVNQQSEIKALNEKVNSIAQSQYTNDLDVMNAIRIDEMQVALNEQENTIKLMSEDYLKNVTIIINDLIKDLPTKCAAMAKLEIDKYEPPLTTQNTTIIQGLSQEQVQIIITNEINKISQLSAQDVKAIAENVLKQNIVVPPLPNEKIKKEIFEIFAKSGYGIIEDGQLILFEPFYGAIVRGEMLLYPTYEKSR